jgi:hypothetical protein
MEIADDAAQKADDMADDGDRLIVATDMKVQSDGRISIDSSTRERYGIEEGEYVDAVLIRGED